MARKGVTFYSRRIAYWRNRTGQPAGLDHGDAGRCPRYLGRVLRLKSYATRKRAEAWLAYHYDWRSWLPDKWARIGACETGYGQRPGRWDWDSGTYVSAFGIYRPGYAQHAAYIGLLGWDETRRRLGRLPTPREQLRVAEEIQRRYGFGAWGCGGA